MMNLPIAWTLSFRDVALYTLAVACIAGAYTDRPNSGVNDYADYTDAYDRLYQSYTPAGLGYFYYLDAAGNQLPNPQQYIKYTNHFRKLSQELRFASPADKPFRVIAGL